MRDEGLYPARRHDHRHGTDRWCYVRPGHAGRQPVRRRRAAAVEGASVEIATVGVYELPKLASAVIAAGARVAWDDTAKQVVLPATGMVPIGTATLAAGNGVATVRVRLDGIATEAA